MLQKIKKFCLLAVALVFVLLLSPVILLGLGLILMFWFPVAISHQWKWRQRLRSQGRLMKLQAFDSQSRSGTLIVNSFTLGWGTLECWWTPDTVLELAPVAMPTDEERMEPVNRKLVAHPFDIWIWQRYVSPDTATAILLATRKGDVVARRLREKHPHLEIVKSWTAPAARDEDEGKLKREPQQRPEQTSDHDA